METRPPRFCSYKHQLGRWWLPQAAAVGASVWLVSQHSHARSDTQFVRDRRQPFWLQVWVPEIAPCIGCVTQQGAERRGRRFDGETEDVEKREWMVGTAPMVYSMGNHLRRLRGRPGACAPPPTPRGRSMDSILTDIHGAFVCLTWLCGNSGTGCRVAAMAYALCNMVKACICLSGCGRTGMCEQEWKQTSMRAEAERGWGKPAMYTVQRNAEAECWQSFE